MNVHYHKRLVKNLPLLVAYHLSEQNTHGKYDAPKF